MYLPIKTDLFFKWAFSLPVDLNTSENNVSKPV